MAQTAEGSIYTIRQWPGEQIVFDGQLEVVVCPSCEIVYAIPERLVSRMRYWNKAEHPQRTVATYCPNGHAWHKTGPTVTEADRLRTQLQVERKALAYTQDRLNETRREADHERARANGYKGVVVKTKKRLTNGVCPYCNRSGFVQLGRHVTSKHPGEAVPA